MLFPKMLIHTSFALLSGNKSVLTQTAQRMMDLCLQRIAEVCIAIAITVFHIFLHNMSFSKYVLTVCII